MEDKYEILKRIVFKVNYQIESLPKPIDKVKIDPILRPLYEKLSKLMGEDEDKLFLNPVAQPPPAALSPPLGKRPRLEGESPLKPVVSPLRKVPESPAPPGAPVKKAGRKTRKQRKPKH